LPLENLDGDLEYCLHRVSFVLPSHFHDVVFVLIDYLISQALALSEKHHEKRVAESVQVVKVAELEVLTGSQTDKITEPEATCTDLKSEKDKVNDGYRRLAEKHKVLVEKAEQEKIKLAEAHAAKLTKLHNDLNLETRGYTEYCQNVRRRLRELHEAVASSFDEVKAQCLPFPNKGVNVVEMMDWVIGEVKAVPDNLWRLNDNFAVLGIKGVLSMLNGDGCQELSRLRDLAASRDDTVLEDVPEDVHKLAGRIV
jgi:hypothetical protein